MDTHIGKLLYLHGLTCRGVENKKTDICRSYPDITLVVLLDGADVHLLVGLGERNIVGLHSATIHNHKADIGETEYHIAIAERGDA